MPKIKVVVLLVRQLRHGFTKTAKMTPNLTDAQLGLLLFRSLPLSYSTATTAGQNDYFDIYTTKIDGVVCPPNISETVAVRTVKLAHRPRIASTTIKFISKPILLSI